jgi:hypothetical protein
MRIRHSITRLALAAGLAAVTSTDACAAGTSASPSRDPDPSGATLAGWAALPADTFVPASEASGSFTGSPSAPFPGQPVQGFSGVHALADGSLLALSDNGFGSKTNSQDFILRIQHIRPETTDASVQVLGGFNLSDPDRHVWWATWRDGGCAASATLPVGYACPTPDRLLTGWDFDVESIQVAADGTIWLGDEFGPWLLHADAEGRLLEAPITTPGVASPSNSTLPAAAVPNLDDSKGFEGLAISPNGKTLYPMLEGSTAEDKAAGLAADLRIFEVRLGDDRKPTTFTARFLRYSLEDAAHALGDFIAVNDNEFLVIERDDGAGAAAKFKRIYLIDARDRDADGYVDKELVVDLMDIANPGGLGDLGDPFTFPYLTIEDVELVDADTIAVLNDNNYPGTDGRGPGVKDVSEFLQIDLPVPLHVDDRLLPEASPIGGR